MSHHHHGVQHSGPVPVGLPVDDARTSRLTFAPTTLLLYCMYNTYTALSSMSFSTPSLCALPPSSQGPCEEYHTIAKRNHCEKMQRRYANCTEVFFTAIGDGVCDAGELPPFTFSFLEPVIVVMFMNRRYDYINTYVRIRTVLCEKKSNQGKHRRWVSRKIQNKIPC